MIHASSTCGSVSGEYGYGRKHCDSTYTQLDTLKQIREIHENTLVCKCRCNCTLICILCVHARTFMKKTKNVLHLCVYCAFKRSSYLCVPVCARVCVCVCVRARKVNVYEHVYI